MLFTIFFVTGKRVAAAVLLLAALTACSQQTHIKSKLIITGSSTLAPLINDIAKRFESSHPGIRVDVQSGGSSRGIADARSGTADIGMVSRALKNSEKDLMAYTVARDAIAIIVHKDNPVQILSRKQLIAIFTGQITQWNKLGGSNGPIVVVNKAAGRATLDVFLDMMKLEPQQIKAHIIIGDNEQGIKTVAGNRYAIGYVSMGSARYHAQTHTPIKLLGIGTIAANLANIENGSYPHIRQLNLITHNKPDGWVKSFIDFSQSAQVHDLVHNHYFLSL